MSHSLIRLSRRLRDRLPTGDTGDVPGWVMVTLMTAGLVIVLWAAAGTQLAQVFQDAIDSVVTGP